MLRRVSVSLTLLLLFALSVSAQVARFLAIDGEGTASVILDKPTRTAYITDGGRGKTAGIQGARINNQPVLDYLLGEGIERLMITCSHPHRDHMEGLKAVVRDDRIQSFKEIVFIDNEFEKATKLESLHTIYNKKWGAQGKASVAYSSAALKDAFAGSAREGAQVRVSNFVYDPKRIGKDVHDQSVVTHYEISDHGKTVRLVDFDDASSALIEAWASRLPLPRLDVLVAPHHGSAHNDISPILERRKEIGLSDVIITVNAANRYDHPAPEVLLRLLRELGVEHVHVTGSTVGESVQVTPQGIVTASAAEHRNRLASLIESQIDRHLGLARNLLGKAHTQANGKVILTAGVGGETREAVLAALDEKKLLSAKEMSTLRRSVQSLDSLEEAFSLVRRDEQRRPVATRLLRGFDPFTLFPTPDEFGPHPPDKSTERYRELFQRASNDAGENPGSFGQEGPSPTGGHSEGPPTRPPSGQSPSGQPPRPAPPVVLTGSRPSSPRRSFHSMRSVRTAAFGGILLGNDPQYEGQKPRSLEFPTSSEEGEGGTPWLRITFDDGTTADYADLTSTELWAAYHFVHPLQVKVGGETWSIPGNSAGLVGMYENQDTYWDFAIHPAIANTSLARDAMRVDMMISALAGGMPPPPGLDEVSWTDLSFETYQWYDAPARIRVASGRIDLTPESGPADCLMRLRLLSIDGSTEEDVSLETQLGPVCNGFDALLSIDRLARIVAVLNWYVEASGQALPPLPDTILPHRERVPSSWPYSAVFARAPGGGIPEFASLDPPATPMEESEVSVRIPGRSNSSGPGLLPLLAAGGGIVVLLAFSVWLWRRGH